MTMSNSHTKYYETIVAVKDELEAIEKHWQRGILTRDECERESRLVALTLMYDLIRNDVHYVIH